MREIVVIDDIDFSQHTDIFNLNDFKFFVAYII